MAGRFTIVLEGDGTSDQKTTITLKKWSMMKCLSLLKDVGEVAKLLGEDFKFDGDLNAIQIAHLLMTLGEEAGARITRLIHASVTDPKISEEEILEWTLEDYIGVLAKLIEMNLTERLTKNFVSLKAAFKDRLPPQVTEPTKKPSNQGRPQPAKVSSRS